LVQQSNSYSPRNHQSTPKSASSPTENSNREFYSCTGDLDNTPAIANHIRRLIDSASNTNPITIPWHWIAGHAGIQGNNAADANASAAAHVSASTACNMLTNNPQSDERTIVNTGNFVLEKTSQPP
jgi:ribonuclease HI